jgi:hypothetical protein
MSAASMPLTFASGTPGDQAAALVASLAKLQIAAANVVELAEQAGFAGMRGDTVDDLRTALAIHGHVVHQFNVTVRTSCSTSTFCTCATSSMAAAQAAAECQGDTPCGITVTPVEPDRQALAATARAMGVKGRLDDALKDPTLRVAINSFARKQLRRSHTTDFKSLAANDRD